MIARGRTMLTRTGRLVHALDLKVTDIDILDIAWGLSGEGRFTNQACATYSVAQHSFLMAVWAANLGYPAPVCYQCLLHDAPEAYLADVATPLKEQLPQYREAEDRAWTVICEALCCPVPLHPIVKELDRRALRTELRDLFPDYESDGAGPKAEPMPDKIVPWPRPESFQMFLEAYGRFRPPAAPLPCPVKTAWIVSGRAKLNQTPFTLS